MIKVSAVAGFCIIVVLCLTSLLGMNNDNGNTDRIVDAIDNKKIEQPVVIVNNNNAETEDDKLVDTIHSVRLNGYKLKDRLLRPATVLVYVKKVVKEEIVEETNEEVSEEIKEENIIIDENNESIDINIEENNEEIIDEELENK